MSEKSKFKSKMVQMLVIFYIVALIALGTASKIQPVAIGGQKEKSQVWEHVRPSLIALKSCARDVAKISSRLPRAIGRSAKLSAKSFLTSSAVLFPVGLAMNINRPRPVDAWIMRGAAAGIEWAKIGAYFVGAETFFATMRGKEDRLNAYLGSGITSSLLRFNEGPIGMAQGFAVGYGFMYAIDKFVVQDPQLGPSARSLLPGAQDASARKTSPTTPFSTATKPAAPPTSPARSGAGAVNSPPGAKSSSAPTPSSSGGGLGARGLLPGLPKFR